MVEFLSHGPVGLPAVGRQARWIIRMRLREPDLPAWRGYRVSRRVLDSPNCTQFLSLHVFVGFKEARAHRTFEWAQRQDAGRSPTGGLRW